MSNKRLLKILIILCVTIAGIGVWAIKNSGGGSGWEAAAIDLQELKSRGLPIVIDFGSDSCEPCKRMAPVLERAYRKTKGKAVIRFVDVWKHPAAADGFPRQLIPTQFFINADGTPYDPSEEFSKELGLEFLRYGSKTTGEHLFPLHQGGLTDSQMDAILADMGVAE
jgi:thioredoxin 1